MIKEYFQELGKGEETLTQGPAFATLCRLLDEARGTSRQVFFAGNGGSAANANHLATDLIYGVGLGGKATFRVHSLAANASVMTCLGNDTGYENVFSRQLESLGQAGDLVLAFSGSGNSPNILRLLESARRMKITSFSFLGFDGGKAKALSDHCLHFPIHDMQVVEDLHMVAGHLCMKALR